MSKPTTFTPAEIEVMVAIFNQIEFGKISTEKLRQDLGIQSSGTATSRLSRLREKLGNRPKGARKSAANTGDTTPPSTPKGKAAGKGKKGIARPTNKRKIVDEEGEDEEGEDEEGEDEESDLEEGWDGEADWA